MHLPDNTLLHGGTYRIIRFINSGGFGCTYEAEHVMLKKRVAIKEFFVKDFCNRDEQTAHVTVATQSKKGLVDKLRQKFIEEARTLSGFEHPNIVQVSDVFEENGTAYFVMKYIDGLSLNEIIQRFGPLPEEKALYYIRQVADALNYVHSRNCLHLDVKPSNILIDENDCAILIDFGASKQYDEEDGENTSTLLGKTPGYAPLEQMGNDVVKFTPATDIYALGATLYKLLTGKTPPSANLIASGDSVDSIQSSISEISRKTIQKSMEIKRSERIQTINQFLEMLSQDFVSSHQITAEQTLVDFENKEESLDFCDESSNRKIWYWGLIGVFFFIVIIFSILKGNDSSKGDNRAVSDLERLETGLNTNVRKKSKEVENTEILDNSIVEVPASYPGGENALIQFISANINCPSEVVEGTVIVRFRVLADGSVGEIHIKQSLSSECDKAAIEVVSKLNHFIPAKKQGNAVPVWLTLPIKFSLQ